MVNSMIDDEICSLPYHDEYWSSESYGWVLWGYGEINNGVSYDEFSSTYDEDLDEWVNWRKPRALFDGESIATRMRIKSGTFAPQCLAPNSTARVVIKAWSTKPSESDIYIPCSFASFGPSDASIGGTVVPGEDAKVFILTFGCNQIKDDGAYLYIRCINRIRTIGKVYPDEAPYWNYGGPSQYFSGDGDDTYYKLRLKGQATSCAQAIFSTCGATELFATWDWNRVPDSIWKRDTTAPLLVDTLDVVDTKAPLPNPPEFHIKPVVDKIKVLADYQVYAMAKLVEDVPFAGGVEYLYVWDDYALSFIDPADIPDWQQSREYCWAVGDAIEVQDKIWNQNMAAWKLKLKAKDSSGNETLCTTEKELIFNEIFELGLEIKIRLCNPDAQPGDPDYGLKEIYFDSYWDGTIDGVDKTETLNWWTDFGWVTVLSAQMPQKTFLG